MVRSRFGNRRPRRPRSPKVNSTHFKRLIVRKFSAQNLSAGAKIPPMLATRIKWTALLPGLSASMALAISQPLISQPLAAQSASQPAATPVVHRIPYSRLLEIHVDQDCHILPPAAEPPTTKKPRLRKDPVICHLESMAESNHVEEAITGNQIRRSKVRIQEQTYVLQNVTTAPVTFVVEQFVPEGWRVDSDPQPAKVDGSTAIFQVNADPGQTVQLHVGLRHTKPLRTKFIKASVSAPSASNRN